MSEGKVFFFFNLALTERNMLKINKIVRFWWSISHWETRIGIFGAMIDGNIKLSNLFCEMRLLRSLRPLRLLRLLRSLRPQTFQDLENHYWALQSHPGCWIKLYFDILKTIIFGEIMKYHSSFFAPFLLEAVEASLCYFCEISKCPHIRISKLSSNTYNLTCIFLSLRAQLKKTLCPRTPCR